MRAIFTTHVIQFLCAILANTTHRLNVEPMLAHRLQRRPNIGPTLPLCVVFAGMPMWCESAITLLRN